MTDPEVMRVAVLIAGLVTDRGGVFVPRSYPRTGVEFPCIVGCQDATRTIHDGQWIRVDAGSGIVMSVGQG